MKKISVLVVILITIFVSVFIVIKNKKVDRSSSDDKKKFETVTNEVEENKLDLIDYYYDTLLKHKPKIKGIKKNATREEREKMYNYYNDWNASVLEMCKKNGEWEYIVYTDKIGKYNKKDGLLGSFQFNELQLVEGTQFYVKARNDKVERLYYIQYNGWYSEEKVKVELMSEKNVVDIKNESKGDRCEFDPVDYHYYVELINYEQQNVKKNATREEREKYYYYDNNIKEAVFEMCKKNGEWEYIVYTDKMGEYNKKDGLLGDFKFDSLKLVDDNEIAPYIYVEASNNKVKRLYHIYWNEIFDINVELVSEENLKTNEVTNYELKTFTKENSKQNFIDLCKEGMKYPSEYEWAGTYYGDDVAVSNKFREKYPYFLDIFIHYSPLEYNKITLKDIDIDNQIATFEVDSILECKRRTYDVKYLLDDNKYLNDVELQLNSEKDIEPDKILKNNYDGSQSFYYNTNWELYKKAINYSDIFFNKFKKYKSDFVDIELLGYNFKFKEPYYNEIRVFENKPGVVCKFLFKDKTLKYYYRKFIYNNKGQLDDVINIKLPYDSSMTLEEVRDAYIRDYVEKK